ncbi:MAG: hypothetical protein ACRDLP_15515, partial [Solirubrobacteraceae bacterium]
GVLHRHAPVGQSETRLGRRMPHADAHTFNRGHGADRAHRTDRAHRRNQRRRRGATRLLGIERRDMSGPLLAIDTPWLL